MMRFICLCNHSFSWAIFIFLLGSNLSYGANDYPTGEWFSFFKNSIPDSTAKNSFHSNIPPSIWETLLLEELALEESAPDLSDISLSNLNTKRLKKKYDINRITPQEMEAIGGISPFAIHNFFIERNRRGGSFESIYQLKLINGWDQKSIKRILPFLKIDEQKKATLFRNFKLGKLKLSISSVKRSGIPKNYQKNWLGLAWGLSPRLLYKLPNVFSFGIMGASSPYEVLFKKGYSSFDRFSFHLSVQNVSPFIKQVTVGDFHLSWGLGLVANRSFLSPLYSRLLPPLQLSRIHPCLSNRADKIFRGISSRIGTKHLHLSLFFSRKKQDAKFKNGCYSIQNTDLHRSKEEWEQKNQITQHALGVRLDFTQKNFALGINAIHTYWTEGILLQNLPNYATLAKRNWHKISNFSFDYHYSPLKGNIFILGEFATSSNRGWGNIHQLIFNTNDWGRYSIILRYLSANYCSLWGRSLSHYSTLGNEWGTTLKIENRLWKQSPSLFLFDLFSSIKPRFHQKTTPLGIRCEWETLWHLPKKSILRSLFRYQGHLNQSHTISAACDFFFSPLQKLDFHIFSRYSRDFASLKEEKAFSYALGLATNYVCSPSIKVGILSSYYFASHFNKRIFLPLHRASTFDFFPFFWGKGAHSELFIQAKLYELFHFRGKILYSQPLDDVNRMQKGWGLSLSLIWEIC